MEDRGPVKPGRLPEEGGERGGAEPRLRGPWWFTRRRELTPDQRRHLLSQLYFEGTERRSFLDRFATLLALSVLIAVFGLAEDSAPVVIGAMVISPLATPLLGLAAALVMGWPRRQLETAGIIVAGTIGSIALAWLALTLIPEPRELTLESQQLLDRTEPSLLDLGIAIVAGAAGAYVLIRREAVGALPGIAIAVALVPPLATVGMMLELGEPRLAGEAFLLYITNVAGIVLAGALVLLIVGMRPGTIHDRLTRRARVGISVAVIAVLVVAYPLSLTTAERIRMAIDQDTATGIARDWLERSDLTLEDLEVEGASVRIEISGSKRPPPLQPLADRLADELEEDIDLTVDWTRAQRFEVRGGG